MPQHVAREVPPRSPEDDSLPSPVGGQGRNQVHWSLKDRVPDAQRSGVECDAAGEGRGSTVGLCRPRSVGLARRTGRGAGGSAPFPARAATSCNRGEGQTPATCGTASPRGGRPGLPGGDPSHAGHPGRVSQSVHVPWASSVLRSEEWQARRVTVFVPARRSPSIPWRPAPLELSGEPAGRPRVLRPDQDAGDGSVQPMDDSQVDRSRIGRANVIARPVRALLSRAVPRRPG